jgi:hypothetical protein
MIFVTGTVAYQKVVYETQHKRKFDIHYLGDQDTRCVDKNAMNAFMAYQKKNL